MNESTTFFARLGVAHPIIQAPMAGATTTPELAAAVSNAGALGSLGAAAMTPEQIHSAITAVRRLTDRPFNVNLFADHAEPAPQSDPAAMLAILARYHAELGLPAPETPAAVADPFDRQLDAVLDAGAPIFSFTFGIPSDRALAALKARGVVVLGTATTVAEAQQLAAAGVDAVVAQGGEAGGHRGTFVEPLESGMVGTMALVPQIVDAVALPVIASGGIMDGRGIVAARALGAAGVQMGTAFLTCRESGASAVYKAAVRASRDDQTVVTRAYTGRPARMMANEFTRAFAGRADAILPHPLQRAATAALRAKASALGESRLMYLLAGQASGLARDLSAADLVHALVAEAAAVSTRLGNG